MPRFHFNMHDGKTWFDRIGTELDSLDAARIEAIGVAGRIILENAAHVSSCREWRLEVTNAQGLVMLWLDFSVIESPVVSISSHSQTDHF
ncbi:hypothetical protein [Methylobacterium sp. Leaf117]|uniref:DUF6894 family protein n=1 Tax=Methylobacterium sp. Leaf117 TaxID=1736260 RepID=UPI00072C04D9|nr:hypothetical protein [Methylobacterium sp. Leaf117]KQP80238.1 hypothetical protein ASF57_17740 [Methylobacterium sp. Leaf117]